MENPIYSTYSAAHASIRKPIYSTTLNSYSKYKENADRSFLSKVKDSFFNHNGFEQFNVKPQMPIAQISHFAKKAVQQNHPVAIQINEQDDIISEIIGYPSISEHSGQLVIQSIDRKVIYLITGSSIRHIRKA